MIGLNISNDDSFPIVRTPCAFVTQNYKKNRPNVKKNSPSWEKCKK